MKKRIILTCSDPETMQVYAEKAKSPEIEVDAVSSLSELYDRLLETSYSGILIDVRTKIRASGQEKQLMHTLLEMFPVLDLNFDKTTGEVRSLLSGQARSGKTIEDFLNKECISFQPRKIRADPRKNFNMNVLLSEDGESYAESTAVRSVTLNISKGGCFIYSTREWALQSRVWFSIKELSDPRPIIGELRWQIPWGKFLRIPGIGIKFIHIHEEQQRSLCDKFEL